ncbi:MAG: glycosyltransferase family 2 protein [Candidatus Bathyarchaeia archaeon]
MASLLAQSVEKIRKGEFTIAAPSVPDADYAYWIEKNEPGEEELAEQRKAAQAFPHRPLISIITPVWNPPPTLLEDTIRSVIAQTYDNWELCLTDAASNEEVRDVIRRFADGEKRLSVQFLDGNLGISRNSNEAIERCKGEYVALLDHDDTIAPNALFEAAAYLNKRPEADLIYSDRDHMTLEGKRIDPLFKPDWSPDLMLCTNYVVQLNVIRSTLLRELGGFRPETDGAQDWDLILRLAERTDKISHIPKILYHWRQSPSSVSFASIRAKPYAKRAQLVALTGYMTRNQLHGTVHHQVSGYPRIEWQVNPSTLVSIIIFAQHSDGEVLRRSVTSVLNRSSYSNVEIVMVHDRNRSVENHLPKDTKIHTVSSTDSLEYASAYNLGATEANGEIFVFLDERIEVSSSDWLQELVGWCIQPSVGVVGPQLVSPKGIIIHGGVVLGLPGYLFQGARLGLRSPLGNTEWYRNCSAVSKYCLAVKRNLFQEIGSFNENHGVMAGVELCLSARRMGYQIVHTPRAKLLLRDAEKTISDEISIFRNSQQLVVGDDPYFNPNLSYDYTVPTLKLDHKS